jgi:hypothetical protein
MLPSTIAGCASRVETWCLTFSKGRDYFPQKQLVLRVARAIRKLGGTDGKLLDDGVDTKNRSRLKGQHGLIALQGVLVKGRCVILLWSQEAGENERRGH